MECTLHVLIDARALHACIAWGRACACTRGTREPVLRLAWPWAYVYVHVVVRARVCVSASMQMHRRMHVYVCAFVYTRMLICVYTSRS